MSHGARSNPSFARSSSPILCTHLAPFPLRVGRESSSQRHEQPATAYSPHFAHCSPVPCAPPCSAGVSAEGVPSVSKHLQPTLVLHCAQRAIQSFLMRADAARRPRVAGSFGVPPADVLWSCSRGAGLGRQCPRPAAPRASGSHGAERERCKERSVNIMLPHIGIAFHLSRAIFELAPQRCCSASSSSRRSSFRR